MCVLLITHYLRLVKRLGTPVNQFNHTSWMAVVTPTDRPQSLYNPSFGNVLVLSIDSVNNMLE